MMVAFWTSVPLFAVSLAVIWPQRVLPLPVAILWLVVLASSAFLTVRAGRLARRRNAGNVYVFDGDSSSYDHLPSYWKEEREEVAR